MNTLLFQLIEKIKKDKKELERKFKSFTGKTTMSNYRTIINMEQVIKYLEPLTTFYADDEDKLEEIEKNGKNN